MLLSSGDLSPVLYHEGREGKKKDRDRVREKKKDVEKVEKVPEIVLTLGMTSQKSHHQPLHMAKLPLKASISKTATKAINFQHKLGRKQAFPSEQ